MIKKTTSILAAISASICAPLQAEYSSEVQLGYANLDVGGDDIDVYATGVTFFTSPLSYRGKTPLDEAAFFNRVGEVDIAYSRAEDSNVNFDTYGASYTHRGVRNPHGFNASWLYSDTRSSVTSYGAGYFYYLKPGFTVGFDVDVIDRFRNDQWTYRVSSKRLISFEGDRWVTVEGGLNWTDYAYYNRFRADVATNYYLTPRTSVGLGLGTDENFDNHETRLMLTRYFKDNIAIDLGYNREHLKRAADPERIQITGRYRF